MRFKKGESGTIVITDLKQKDIINLLKVQIKMRLVFISPTIEEPVGNIYLLNRVVNNDVQMIQVSENVDAKKPEIVPYSDVINRISEFIDKYECQIIVNAGIFRKKEPLIAIIPDIKDEIINGCVYIDYDNGMFSVVNKPQNGLPNKLYYWEDTSSLFVFGKNGPQINYETEFDNIEDIICK